MWILNTTLISQKKTLPSPIEEINQDHTFSSNKHFAKSSKEVQGKEGFRLRYQQEVARKALVYDTGSHGKRLALRLTPSTVRASPRASPKSPPSVCFRPRGRRPAQKCAQWHPPSPRAAHGLPFWPQIWGSFGCRWALSSCVRAGPTVRPLFHLPPLLTIPISQPRAAAAYHGSKPAARAE
jgi:hypothetical protein